MNTFIKKQLMIVAQSVTILMWLPGILLLNSCRSSSPDPMEIIEEDPEFMAQLKLIEMQAKTNQKGEKYKAQPAQVKAHQPMEIETVQEDPKFMEQLKLIEMQAKTNQKGEKYKAQPGQIKAYQPMELETKQEIEKLEESEAISLYKTLKSGCEVGIKEIIAKYVPSSIGYSLYMAVKEGDDLERILTILYNSLPKNKNLFIVKYVAYGLLCTIEEGNKKGLLDWKKVLGKLYFKEPTIIYYNFNSVLGKLLELLEENTDILVYQKNLQFLYESIEIPNKVLMNRKQYIDDKIGTSSLKGRFKLKEREDPKKLSEIRKVIENQLASRPISGPKSKSIISTDNTISNYIYSVSPERQEDYYSDSEEEDAPHFDGIYNLTKHGVFNIEGERKEDYYKPMKLNGSVINNYASSIEEVSRSRLKTDAYNIWKFVENRKELTILCVALRQNDGRIKKFVFTNQLSVYQFNYSDHSKRCFSTKETMQAIVKKAHELGYHVVMAQQAHAEGELLQFLQERPTRYTNLVALGCNRSHCQECVNMMSQSSIFGNNWKSLSDCNIYTDGLSSDNWYIPMALKSVFDKWNIKEQINSHLDKLNKGKTTIESVKPDSKSWYFMEDGEENHKKLGQGGKKWEDRKWKRKQ